MIEADVLTCGCKDVLYPWLTPSKAAPAGWVRLNSGENSRLVFGIAHLHALMGLAKVSTEAGDHQKRIERVFGHLKRNLKLRTLKLRGLVGAAEEFTMAAVAYNLQVLARTAAPA